MADDSGGRIGASHGYGPLDKDAAGQLTVRYSLVDDNQAVQVGPIDWESLWSKTTLAGQTGLPALRYALTAAQEPELWSWLPSIGDTLFQILFPVREVQVSLLSAPLFSGIRIPVPVAIGYGSAS